MTITLSDEQYTLKWGIRRSIRYHDRRQHFFERCHAITMFLSVLFGTATFVSLTSVGDNFIGKASAIIITILTAGDLAIGYSSRARLYEELKKRFIALEGKTVAKDADWEAVEIERLAIEADEPPLMFTLSDICHNELMVADGFKTGFINIPKHKQWTANLLAWA